jgi:hypothetical protein
VENSNKDDGVTSAKARTIASHVSVTEEAVFDCAARRDVVTAVDNTCHRSPATYPRVPCARWLTQSSSTISSAASGLCGSGDADAHCNDRIVSGVREGDIESFSRSV